MPRYRLLLQSRAQLEQIKREAAEQLEAERQRHKADMDAVLRRFYGPRSEAFDPTQLLMFGVFAAAAVPAWRYFARSDSSYSVSNPFLNKRTEALIGRVFTLEKPIIDGTGTVRIDDTIWRVAGPDAPAGSRVRIVQADGASLTVAAA